MRIFYTDTFLSQARTHQVLDSIRKLKPDQINVNRLDRYIYKKVGRRSFLAIGIKHYVGDQQVFVWLQVLHRNSRDWGDFQRQPARYSARTLQPILAAALPALRQWLDRPDGDDPSPPPIPEAYKPWFEPLSFQTSSRRQDLQIYETPGWIQEIAKRSIWDHWASWHRMLVDLSQNPDMGEAAPGFSKLKLYQIDKTSILFARLPMEQLHALFLVYPIISEKQLGFGELDKLQEAKAFDAILANEERGSLSLDELARYTRRTWPSILLADASLWRKISEDDGGNLALSAEEESIIEQLTGPFWGEKRLPCFLDGRAGSGKSTLLSYVFARYCARRIKREWAGKPLYVTINESLLERAREIVLSLLKNNAEISMELDEAGEEGEISSWFRPLHALLKELLLKAQGTGASLADRFEENRRISYHRFRRLYLGENQKFSSDERKLECKRKPQISAETAWFVIRALIKGIDADGFLDPDGFDRLPRDTRRVVSRELFEKVYQDVWRNWYAKLTDEPYNLWDDQDLVRAALNEAPELPEYAMICCDEAQDLTHIEARLLFRLSILSRYRLPESFPSVLPFLFAGDPLQTVNPSGFRWASLKQLFRDEIKALVDRDIPLEFLNLQHNYRSRQAIVGFLNLIQAWRADLYDQKNAVPQHGWSPLECINPTCFILDDHVSIHELIDLLKDTPIIIDDEEGMSECQRVEADPLLKKIFEEDQTDAYRNLLTPAAVKGHEHPKVVVYGFGDGAPEKIWESVKNEDPDGRIADATQETMRHRAEHFWNKLYVALSRATIYLFIIDTKKGYETLWKSLIGESPALPCSLESQWAPHVKGLTLGGKHDLEFLREDNPQGVAERLKKAGEAEQSSLLLRKARAYYLSLSMRKEADECEAIGLETEHRFDEAGKIWQKLKNLDRAEEAFWKGLSWWALDKLYKSRPERQKRERVLMISLLLPLLSGKKKWSAAVKRFLPLMADWLQAGNRPPVLSAQWSALDDALNGGDRKARENLSMQERRILAQVAEELHNHGRQTGDLAAHCWYELRDWNGAIRCWNAVDKKNHVDYCRAMAEISAGAVRLKWYNMAGDYRKTLDIWRTNKSYEDEWMDLVGDAMRKTKSWEELISIHLYRRKRSADKAVTYLLEGYKDIPENRRDGLLDEVLMELLKRKLFPLALRLLNDALKQVSDDERANSLSLRVDVRIARLILSGEVDRGSLVNQPIVKDWWLSFLDRIVAHPEEFCPPLNPDELIGLIMWETEDAERTLAAIDGWADFEQYQDHLEVWNAFKRLRIRVEGPEIIYKRKTPDLDGSDMNNGYDEEIRSGGQNEKLAMESSSESISTADESTILPQTAQLEAMSMTSVSIEQLRLQNFRAYINACLNIEDFTILIGQNGAGKSTLREALEIMRDALTDSINNALSRRGGIEVWIRQSGKESQDSFAIALQLRFEATEKKIRAVYGFDILLEEGGGHRVFQEHLNFSDKQIPHFNRHGDRFDSSLDATKPSLASDQLALPILAGSDPYWNACLEAIKGIEAYILSPERMRHETSALEQKRLAFDGHNAANVLKSLESHPTEYEKLMRGLSAIIPGIRKVYTETWRGRRILRFDQSCERTIKLDATQVSDGTLRIIGILLALYQKPSPSLIFIEELEDSIHPEAFATIIESIEEVAHGTQVIITSHSPVALMSEPVTELRTRMIRWELGRSDIYRLDSPPPKEGDYPFSVGEMLQFNAIPIAPMPSIVRGGFYEVEDIG